MNKKKKTTIIAILTLLAVGVIGTAVYANLQNNDADKIKAEKTEIKKQLDKIDSTSYYEEDRKDVDKLVADAKEKLEKAKTVKDADKVKEEFDKALKKFVTIKSNVKKVKEELAKVLDKENYYEPEQSDIDAILKKYEDTVKTVTTKADVETLVSACKEDLSKVLTKEAKDEKVKSGEIESVNVSTSSLSGANDTKVKANTSTGSSSKPNSGSSGSGGSSSSGGSSGGSGGSTQPPTPPEPPVHKHISAAGNVCGWVSSQAEVEAVVDAKLAYWDNLWESGQISDDEHYKNAPYGYRAWYCSCGMWTGSYKYH